MAIRWEVYLSRRKVNLPVWLKVNKVSSYNDVVSVCRLKGVIPPTKEVYSELITPLLNVDPPAQPTADAPAKKVKASSKKPTKGSSKAPTPAKRKNSTRKSKSGDK